MKPNSTIQTPGRSLAEKVLCIIGGSLLGWAILFIPVNSSSAQEQGTSVKKDKHIATTPYPDKDKNLATEECMQCHPAIATLLRTAGAKHRFVECRLCHLQVHAYVAGVTNYEDILPKCDRCHGHPHGEELIQCSTCHTEAHTPLEIPASRALSQGCYVCHPKLSKEMKTFSTRHTDLYCTACHHTKHGTIPDCLECHQQHTGTTPTSGGIEPNMNAFDQCVTCHPPHKALKVAYPNTTANAICSYCHRKAGEMLRNSNTKHSALPCSRCHPDQHKTIKRCKECHGKTPHPDFMLKKFRTCGGCHGVAHSLVR